MKDMIIQNICRFIQQNSGDNISRDRLDMIKYGAECLYIGLSKSFVIISIACIIGQAGDVLLCMVIFGLIIALAFGLHASNGFVCTILSSIVMIGIPAVSKILYMPLGVKVGCCVVLIAIFFKYAPADTQKRPLVNSDVRWRLKILSLVICLVYSIFAVVNNSYYSYMVIMSLTAEGILILPATYRIFSQNRDNYKIYGSREDLS